MCHPCPRTPVTYLPGPYRTGEGRAEIRVEDRGPGVPPKALERLFEPFYRLEPSRSRDTGGSGLGLSIARSLMQAMQGDVFVENRGEGGLRVRLILPESRLLTES